MDENVLTGLALDKSKSLAGIEPLHCSLFFSFLFELFGAVIHRLQAKKEGCKCGLAAPSTILKVLQEQQTRSYLLMLSLRCPFNRGIRDTPTGDFSQIRLRDFLSRLLNNQKGLSIASASPDKRRYRTSRVLVRNVSGKPTSQASTRFCLNQTTMTNRRRDVENPSAFS
jgi:hypothetical protein